MVIKTTNSKEDLKTSAVNCSRKKLRLRCLQVPEYASDVKFSEPFSQCINVTIATFTVIVTLVKGIYTNADSKISLYIQIHIKIMP